MPVPDSFRECKTWRGFHRSPWTRSRTKRENIQKLLLLSLSLAIYVYQETQASQCRKRSRTSIQENQERGQAAGHWISCRQSLACTVDPTYICGQSEGWSGRNVGLDGYEVCNLSIAIICVPQCVHNVRYIPTFCGVVLSHSNLRFLAKEAVIQADCPHLVCTVGFDATIWSPCIGMKLGSSPSVHNNLNLIEFTGTQWEEWIYVPPITFPYFFIALSMFQYPGITFQLSNGNSNTALQRMIPNLDWAPKKMPPTMITSTKHHRKGKRTAVGDGSTV